MKSKDLTEGPLGFAAGAAQEIGRKIGQAGSSVVQAGKRGSAASEIAKAVAQLAQLLSFIDKTAPGMLRNAQPAQQAQNPQQKLELAPKDAPAGAGRVQPKGPFAASQKSKMIDKGDGYGAQYQFNSFMQALHGEKLDEGMWDFVKGAGGAVRDKINSYADKPSVFKDIYAAGQAASAKGDATRSAAKSTAAAEKTQKSVEQAKMQAIQMLRNIMQAASQLGDEAPQVIMNAIRKSGGTQQQRIARIIAKHAPKYQIAM